MRKGIFLRAGQCAALSSFRGGKYFCRKGSGFQVVGVNHSLFRIVKINKAVKRDSFSNNTAIRVVFTQNGH